MYFLLNDMIFNLELQVLAPPVMARRFSCLTLECVQRLGREIFAEEPRLQHRMPERARRLAGLIVTKAPSVNAALFVAPARGCQVEHVAVRLASLNVDVLAELNSAQQAGRLTPAVADQLVWARANAA